MFRSLFRSTVDMVPFKFQFCCSNRNVNYIIGASLSEPPHEREVWCEDVQYIYIYIYIYIFISYGRRTRTRAMRDSHVGAHVSNIDTRTRTLIDCRLDYQG